MNAAGSAFDGAARFIFDEKINFSDYCISYCRE